MSRFAETSTAVLHELIRASPLAALVTLDRDGMDARHVPLILDPEAGTHGTLRGHVARANPLARRSGTWALAIFRAADAYVTPALYPGKAEDGRVVPTWNYAVAQAHGPLEVIEDAAWIARQIEALTNQNEARRAHPWRVADAPPDYVAKLLGAIVGIQIPIARLEGTVKASQNRDARDRDAVRTGLAAEPAAGERGMAHWMREVRAPS